MYKDFDYQIKTLSRKIQKEKLLELGKLCVISSDSKIDIAYLGTFLVFYKSMGDKMGMFYLDGNDYIDKLKDETFIYNFGKDIVISYKDNNLESLIENITKLKKEKDIKYILINNLQLVETNTSIDDSEKNNIVLTKLEKLSKELNICIVVLSQLPPSNEIKSLSDILIVLKEQNNSLKTDYVIKKYGHI